MSGKVFDNTLPVNHKDIPSILNKFNTILKVNAIPVGSSATPQIGCQSGDIDIIVDESQLAHQFHTVDSKSLRKCLYNYIVNQGFRAAQSGVIVHVCFPFENNYYQIDIMVVADARNIAKLHTHSSSMHKGVNKHLLLNAIAKNKGYFWSPWQGLFERIDNKKGSFITNDTCEISKILLESSVDSLSSVESILACLTKDQSKKYLKQLELDPNWVKPKKLLGRTFNHLEDLITFYGSEGSNEVLAHLHELLIEKKPVRLKWDGGLQIYWGREYKNGPLIFCNHNAWSRKIKTSSPRDIQNFIANNSGVKSPERSKFAKHFASLYHIFDNATPKDFVGFVYADALYTEVPVCDYNFNNSEEFFRITPNPLTNTSYLFYNVDKIEKSKVMVAAHAYYSIFGQNEHLQDPSDNFDQFNTTNDLIVQNPIYSAYRSRFYLPLFIFEKTLNNNKQNIDNLLFGSHGIKDINIILHRYINHCVKTCQLLDVGSDHFLNWLSTSTVSKAKQSKIHTWHFLNPNVLSDFFSSILQCMSVKDRIIKNLEQNLTTVKVVNGEGFVKYADCSKKFGHIKLVPRTQWFPK